MNVRDIGSDTEPAHSNSRDMQPSFARQKSSLVYPSVPNTALVRDKQLERVCTSDCLEFRQTTQLSAARLVGRRTDVACPAIKKPHRSRP